MARAVNHPVIGQLRVEGLPVHLSQYGLGNRQNPPPLLGQHNDYVYGEMPGLSQDEIIRLKDAGVI